MSPGEIEVATCTDIPQEWGKKGSSEQYLFNPVPVHQFCHLRKRRRTFEWEDKNVSPELLASVKEIISEGKLSNVFCYDTLF